MGEILCMNDTATVRLRMASPSDAAELLKIYAPYVRQTAISFEYEPPSEGEFRERVEDVLQMFPYLAAVQGGRIVGYAYAHPYGVRKAYSWSVELSVYVARDCRGLGIGRMLYEAMEKLLKAQHVTNLYALVAGVAVEDEYLTHDSVKFHEAMGYVKVGHMHKAGYKFGRWYDMMTFEKLIAEHPEASQPDVISVWEVDPVLLKELEIKG